MVNIIHASKHGVSNLVSRPRILAVLPHVIPSTIVYILKPLSELHRSNSIVAEFALEYMVSRAHVRRADVIVFCRNASPRHTTALDEALRLGKPIIYDLDDDLLSFYANAVGDSESSGRLNQLRLYLQSASIVRVYSERLAQTIREINSQVIRIDGPIDLRLVPASFTKRDVPSSVKIAYATGRPDDELANIFLDDVERVLEKYPGQVEIFFWGFRGGKLARHSSVHVLNPVTDYNRFLYRFARYGFEIGLAPLPNDTFHQSKTNIKFREYAACHIAGIYSNTPVYSECVEHGKTGLLVENLPGAWFDALSQLIENKELRASIQEQAHIYARGHYSQEKFCAVWLEQIQSVLSQPSTLSQTTAIDSSKVTDMPSSIEIPSTASKPGLIKLVSRAGELARRFFWSVRARGMRESVVRARWALNDLSLFWKRF